LGASKFSLALKGSLDKKVFFSKYEMTLQDGFSFLMAFDDLEKAVGANKYIQLSFSN